LFHKARATNIAEKQIFKEETLVSIAFQ